MNSAARQPGMMTEAECIKWERQQTVRHEFWRGEVFAQAGGTRRHSLIGMNTARAIGNMLTGHECQVRGSDMRIQIASTSPRITEF